MFSPGTGAPDSMMPVLLLPLLFTFFALAARISARAYWRNFGKRKPHWWYVYPLLALGLLFGFEKIFLLFNPFSELDRHMYGQTLVERKVRIAHYLAFIVPLISLVGIVLYDRAEASRARRSTA